MKPSGTNRGWATLLLGLAWMHPSQAAIEGSCEGFPFPLANDGQTIKTTWQVRVLRRDTPLYPTETSAASVQGLPFDQALQPVSLPNRPDPGPRIEIKLADKPAVSGWVERRDLLCATKPLKRGRLERQVFVNTDPYAAGGAPPTAVQAHSDPERRGCVPDGCDKLTRFQHLFVYAENPDTKAVLVARPYRLEGSDHWVGWLDGEKEIIEWNTRFGLQPSELPRSGCDTNPAARDTVWLYLHPDDAAQQRKDRAQPVLGNCDGRWHTYPLRLAIIGQESASGGQRVYKVAAPTLGVNLGAKAQAPSADQTDQMFGRDSIIDALRLRKDVDVMFAIDGTRSMQPYITRTVDIANKVATDLASAGADRGNSFRFGYTVYRDNYAKNEAGCDQQGVCVGLPLSLSCKQEAQRDELNKFAAAMARVKEVAPGPQSDDDYPEQLYAGIRQGLVNLKACPGRAKVLVIIGDNGDRADAIPTDLANEIDTWRPKPIVFAVQTPHSSNVRNQDQYDAAYLAFKRQTEALIESWNPPEYRGRDTKRLDLYASTDTTTVVATVTNWIGRYTSGKGIQAAIDAVSGGAALHEFIDKSLAHDGLELPVLFWERIDQSICGVGKTDCDMPVSHRVTEGYIAADDPDWKKEVWVRFDALGGRKGWLSLLNGLAALSNNDAVDPERIRSHFKDGLRATIEELTGGEPPFSDKEESLDSFLRRTEDLPLRADPMLLQYNATDLERVEPCEIQHIGSYLSVRLNVLEAICRNPRARPSYSETKAKPQCALSTNGQKVPVLTFDPTASTGLGPTPGHSYLHKDALGSGYWLPEDMLP